ncbi:MAG: trypsin-like serine protease [Pseudobdellovibrio sp.]
MKIIFVSLLLFMINANADMCESKDERALSHDSKVGRLSQPKPNPAQNTACTATLISDKCAITASHCLTHNNASQVEFNTPESINSIPQSSRAEDIYSIESFRMNDTVRIGDNWAVIRLKPNVITGQLPGVKQGFYQAAMNVKHQDNEPIRVVEYGYSGTYSYPVADADRKNYAQKTSYGYLKKGGVFLLPSKMTYVASNTNPGAAVISVKTNEVVGIGTHGGCESPAPIAGDKSNAGTFIYGNAKLKAAIKACIGQ